MTSFNGTRTNQKDQQQYLLQVVEKHRQDFTEANYYIDIIKNIIYFYVLIKLLTFKIICIDFVLIIL